MYLEERENFKPLNLKLLVFRINKLLLPAILILYYIFISAESRHYPNYVFSTFHIQPQNFIYTVILSVYIEVLDLVKKRRNDWLAEKLREYHLFVNLLRSSKLQLISFAVVIFSLLFYTLQNATAVMNTSLDSFLYIARHLNAGYDDKMRKHWGFYYDYMSFIKNIIGKSSVVIISPPQEEPWLTSGNAGLDRYFVYPSKVINGFFDALPEIEYEYIMISRGEWPVADESKYKWPRVKIKAEKIWYLDPVTLKVTEFEGDYDPDDPKNDGAWGLIKVRRN
jgi:hypothetical protein